MADFYWKFYELQKMYLSIIVFVVSSWDYIVSLWHNLKNFSLSCFFLHINMIFNDVFIRPDQLALNWRHVKSTPP